jgi:hypothetical protein
MTDARTLDDRHPEDAIFEAAAFLRQLNEVQESYFDKLQTNLELSSEGARYLFDYIFNTVSGQYEDFSDYLEQLGLDYTDFINQPDTDAD